MKNIKFNAGAEQPTVAKRGSGGAADNVQWVVSEVVWAAARGHGVPVPWRLSRLTRYLQDTLQPTGACWDSGTQLVVILPVQTAQHLPQNGLAQSLSA